MASTTFVDNQTVIYASWLNDVNAVAYNGTFIASIVTPSNLVCNGTVSGSGFTSLVANVLASPPAIGSAVPAAGSFTTLSSNSLSLVNPLAATYGGTGLSSPGTSGNVLTSTGSAWASTAPNYIGVNQTWTNVTSSRAFGTTYTNSTGKPIMVGIYCLNSTIAASRAYLTVNGVIVDGMGGSYGGEGMGSSTIVPNGGTYSLTLDGGSITITNWSELR